MVTMIEARKRAYNIFPYAFLGDDATATQTNTVKYIDHLGHTTKTVIDHWPLLEVFGNKETNLLYTDRKKINQLFFEFRERQPSVITPDGPVAAIAMDALTALCKDAVQAACYDVSDEVIDNEQKVKNLGREIIAKQRTLFRSRASQLGLESFHEGGCKVLIDGLVKLISEGFYSLSDVHPRGAVVLRTNPITLSHFNNARATANVVPMGWYYVQVNLSEGGLLKVSVWPGGDNPRINDRCCHPHVKDGKVCFGTMLTDYAIAQASLDFQRVLALTQLALINYCDENPHEHLFKFENAWKAKCFAIPHVFMIEEEEEEDDSETIVQEFEPLSVPTPQIDWSVATGSAAYTMGYSLTAEDLVNQQRNLNRAALSEHSQLAQAGPRVETDEVWNPPSIWHNVSESEWLDFLISREWRRHRSTLQNLEGHHNQYSIADESSRFEYQRQNDSTWRLMRRRDNRNG